MSATPLQLLSHLTLASSIAVSCVGFSRKPLRRLAGTRVAYWLWLAVPITALASLAVQTLPALPLRVSEAQTLLHPLTSSFPRALTDSLGADPSFGSPQRYLTAPYVIWLAGVLLMAALFAHRQRAAVRSLGHLRIDSDGLCRSKHLTAPVLIGILQPRVVVPADFENLYSRTDRALMLAHEQAHRERRDPVANLCASLWLCLFWFNPLMYWALRRFRLDQELACDALVLSRSETNRKRYAEALLKAQLISESDRFVPVGCHWQSNHPLKERIAMLKLRPPRPFHRLAGITFTALLIGPGSLIASAGFAEPSSQAAPSVNAISTDKKIAIEAQDMETRDVVAMIARRANQNILVSDQVRGKITVNLKDVPWREALHIVASSQGLITRESGGILIVDVAH